MKLTAIAERVLRERYLLKDENGDLKETPDDLVERVARAVAKAELQFADTKVGGDQASANEMTYYRHFKQMIGGLDFLPNSPTLMNAGTPGGQCSACFVLPVEDNIPSIFETVKQMAIIFKSGGGVGLPMSRLRPKGSPVRSTGGVSSGPVSFMRVYNTTAEVVAQGGKRRGALMGVLRIDHPDIFEFIKVKQDLTQLTSFNLSIAVTDAFMEALGSKGSIELVDPSTKTVVRSVLAEEIWREIITCAHATGEPGLIFIDRVNKAHKEWVAEEGKIEGTNPCSEAMLLEYESCNLGSLNLSSFVLHPYTKNAAIDTVKLARITRTAVRFLDNVIEINNFPLPEIREATFKTRKIGLGVMGFADMLVKLGFVYGDPKSYEALRKVMGTIRTAARETSEQLAEERGPYPLSMRDAKPRRNGTLMAIAPTGSISMIADVTGGIEPMFAVAMRRESVLDGKPFIQVVPTFRGILEHYSVPEHVIEDAVEALGSGTSLNELCNHDFFGLGVECSKKIDGLFTCAHEVPALMHVGIQAAAQLFIDQGISKTINLPRVAEVDDVSAIFLEAYKLGCKSTTVYRDGCREHQPMSAAGGDQKIAQKRPKMAMYDAEEKIRVRVVSSEKDAEDNVTGESHVEQFTPGMQWGKVLERLKRLGLEPPPFYDEEKIGDDRAIAKLRMKERPQVLPGHTIKMKTGCGTLFVTISTDEKGNPIELFAHHGKAGVCSQAQCEAIGRLSSMSLRAGIDPQEIIGQLRGITCHETSGIGANKVLSCADGIAQAIAKALNAAKPKPDMDKLLDAAVRNKLVYDEERPHEDSSANGEGSQDDPEATHRVARPVYSGACPKCGAGVIREAGCLVCKACGWEKCS